MPNPLPGDVHVNQLMTNHSISLIQSPSRFVATRIFPAVGVAKQSDKYLTIPAGEFHRDQMKKRAPGTRAKMIDYEIDTSKTYFCDRWGIGHVVPDDSKANADAPINLDRNATRLITMQGLIRREQLFSDTFMTTGVWSTDYTGVAASPGAGEVLRWDDANSDPIKNIEDAKVAIEEATGFEPNVLNIGRHVYAAFKHHPDILDRIKYGQTSGSPAQVNQRLLAQLFDVEEVLVMKAVKNTAAKGQTSSNSFIGSGKSALLVHRTDTPDPDVPSAGYTFGWTGRLGAGKDGVRIRTYREEGVEGDVHEIDMWIDQKQTVADLGAYFATIVS